MYNVKLYNKISKVGLDDLDPAKYTCSEDFTDYDAVLVRSAKLHDVEFPKNLRCIARAGAGVNNIPIDRCSEEGIVVFNTPGANANAVKELVICALLLASRKVVQGANWVKGLKGTPVSVLLQRRASPPTQARKSPARSWASSVWVRSALRLQTRLLAWIWRSGAMTRTCRLTVHSSSTARSSTLPSWTRFSQTATTSPFMFR